MLSKTTIVKSGVLCYHFSMALSDRILKSIEFGNEILVGFDDLKHLPYKLMWGSSLQGYSRKSIQATLSRLVSKQLIKKTLHKGQVYLALTELGEKWLEKHDRKVLLKLTGSTTSWDSLYRFIIFDIPERDRVIRDTLRASLKDLGAVCWQRSVWVTKENITRELGEFIDKYGLEDYCSVLEVKEIYSPKLIKMLEKS